MGRVLLVAVCVLVSTTGCSAPAEAAPEPEGGGGATPPPADARAPSTKAGIGRYDLGDYVQFGEVTNTLETPIFGVEVEITFIDASGKALTTEPATTAVSRIAPGKSAPLVDTRYGAPQGIAGATMKVLRWQTSGPEKPLTIVESKSRSGQLGAVVEGKARNDSGGALTGIKLVASFRDSAGKVTGVFFGYPTASSVAAGESFPFTVETFDSSVSGAASVQAEGVSP